MERSGYVNDQELIAISWSQVLSFKFKYILTSIYRHKIQANRVPRCMEKIPK